MNSSFQLIIPVYNESSRILPVLNHYTKICEYITVFNNFSVDDTKKLIESRYPKVVIVDLENNGTTETPEWWNLAISYFHKEYVVFGSCSEFLSEPLLSLYDSLAKQGVVELCYTQRTTLTGSYCTDPLYCKPISIFSRSIVLSEVVRFVRWKSIDASLIKPHDSFRSQKSCRPLHVSASAIDYQILHRRPMPKPVLITPKLQQYAKEYARIHLNNRVMPSLLDSTLRVLLDTLRCLRAILTNQSNPAILIEYRQRIAMHFLVVYYSFSSSRLRLF
jgi:hypothetical protein